MHLQIPQHRRMIGKRRVPVRRLRQVIDDRIVGMPEHSRISIGGVSCEKNTGQANAVIEGDAPDASDAAGDGDVGQADAVPERIVLDAPDTIGDGDIGQAAAQERLVLDAGDAVGNPDAGKTVTPCERFKSNTGDGVGDGDFGQAAAGRERIVPDTGNRPAIGRAGDNHRAAGTGVFRYGDGAVIGGEIELGLYRDRQQEQQRGQQPHGAGGRDAGCLHVSGEVALCRRITFGSFQGVLICSQFQKLVNPPFLVVVRPITVS